MRQARGLALLGLLGISLAGCGPSFSSKAKNGITFYCPGAGNVDFGDRGIREGLEAAGYKGEVASVLWTISLNPAIDQAVKLNARVGGMRLARTIKRYADRFPGRPINLVGLSAGTGVALFACERLDDDYQVDNVLLLSGSISCNYDIDPALRGIKGQIINYYSPQDAILAGPMKIFGTIDGKLGVDGAGAVGLKPPRHKDRVVNIRWRREWARYGYYGGHTDVTNPNFVEAKLASHIIESGSASAMSTTGATSWARAPQDEHLN